MEGYKVLITTSGLGSRLGQLTDFTNKSLVRIGNKPAISYIIESYPKETKFVITLGHYGFHVKQFLTLAYPEYDFTFVNVDKFKGKGSSLGYSLLQAKSELNCPFIFHASDTLFKTYQTIPPTYNYIIGAHKNNPAQYRTLNLINDTLVRINETGELNYDLSYVGVAGIKDFKLFFTHLENLVNTKRSDISDVHAIHEMLSTVSFKVVNAGKNNWFDTGNTTELAKSRKHFNKNIEVLDKKDESIFFFEDYVIKFFSNSTINKNRVSRAQKLFPLVPKILGHTDNFYKYKKAEGNLFSKSVTEKSFLKFLEWAEENLWVKTSKDFFDKDCNEFYIKKSLNRISSYLESHTDPKNINGEDTPTIYDLFNQIDFPYLCNGIPSQFHGDFILDNIIETPEGFSLIDWRQDFAGDLEIGDIYYDLAKLNHNLTVNHGIVDQELFNPSPDNCHILCNSTLLGCKKVLHQFILDKGYDLNKVEILTSIIWLNMSPLHEYPFNKFLFNFGKYNLYKNIKNES